MKQYYWAVRPISTRDTGANTRIEKAETAKQACLLAFGRGIYGIVADEHMDRAVGISHRRVPIFEAKNLGSRVAFIQSDNKRIAALRDPMGWEPVHGK